MVIFDYSPENSCRKRGELVRRLIALTQRNGYQIIQTNGQRVYAPPASRVLRVPPRGCEVFVGKLHKNLFEDELIPLFESIGPLYKFRLMLDFSEQTRGYAFATYFTREDAAEAVAQLNGFEIRPKLHIGVYKSVDNCRLFIGNLPTDKTRMEVKELLNKFVGGVVDIIMYPDYINPELNRGFVFVEFEDHRQAAMARRQFSPENLIAWGQILYVDWADPLPEVDYRVMAKVTILYLKNLPMDYSTSEVYEIVCSIVGSQVVKKVHKMYNYAFVHFINRRSAEIAMLKFQDIAIGQCRVEVEWARPRRYSKKFRLNKSPDNFCTSVPPNMRRLVHQRLAELSFCSNTSTVNKLDSLYNTFAQDVRDSSSPFQAKGTDCDYGYFTGPELQTKGTDCNYGYFTGPELFCHRN